MTPRHRDTNGDDVDDEDCDGGEGDNVTTLNASTVYAHRGYGMPLYMWGQFRGTLRPTPFCAMGLGMASLAMPPANSQQKVNKRRDHNLLGNARVSNTTSG